jgi:integrase
VTARAETAASHGRLLEKLISAVRPEFRVELYLPDPADPVLGLKSCLVDGCDRSTYASRCERGMCSRHAERWRVAGRPDLTVFAVDAGPTLTGRSEPGRCTARGCGYGVNAFGLCMRHSQQWKSAGRPDRVSWSAGELPVVPDPGQCALPFCTLWVENGKHSYCRTHATRWRQLGRPAHDDYVEHCLLRGRARVDFRGVAPLLRLEFQYAMQCRHEEQMISTPPYVVRWAIRQAHRAGVASMLDMPAEQWREQTTGAAWPTARAFLLYVRDVVAMLRDGTGWEVEYQRDVWRLHTLPGLRTPPGRPTYRNHLRFDRIDQPWLRALAKRFLRLRLTSGRAVSTALIDMQALTRFSAFLTTAAVRSLAEVDRTLLERYLAWVSTQPGGQSVKEDCVTSVGTFFAAIRQHGWDDTLPTTAAFFTGDIPPRPARVTRHLAEYLMVQVENPANLDRWPTSSGRLITIILIRCGLRASDACTLSFDCLLHDRHNAPYLRYFNNKMGREAAVPIDEELEAEIRTQQQRVTDRWPDAHPYLFPHDKHGAGSRPLTYHGYRGSLIRWLADCDVRDEHGKPAKLTPHQWRHTFACRLINRDVPQEVIRVLLDHQSTQMTEHYARITDQTVRRRWEQAVKVNINGERVEIEPDGPLAQAAWAKTRYGLATQTLPHGYCGLPVQKSCPHANACLTCPVFLTGPEFLPELHEHRRRTHALIDTAQTAGHTRVVQMNTQVVANLDRMINGIEDGPGDSAHAS